MMWIPFHIGIEGNLATDLRARQAILSELVYGRPPVARDFLPNASRLEAKVDHGK
jgi:hypothetical protein